MPKALINNGHVSVIKTIQKSLERGDGGMVTRWHEDQKKMGFIPAGPIKVDSAFHSLGAMLK